MDAVQAKEVLEVGADQGGHTVQLQEYCSDVGGHLAVVDPGPLSDALLAVLDEENTTLHLQESHVALPSLPTPDVALIDGDHNYFTVRKELELLAERAAFEDRGLPLTLVHDVGWPYGRRDMYYDLSRVPKQHQRPHDRLGLAPDEPGKVASGRGFNAGFSSATVEGGPRNGVLTAVEDFVAADETRRLTVLPVMHGLAVITTDDVAADADDFLGRFENPDVLALLSDTERARVDSELKARDLAKRTAELESELSRLAADREVLSTRATESEARAAELAGGLDSIQAHPVLRAARPARRLARAASRALRRAIAPRRTRSSDVHDYDGESDRPESPT